ncbi:MAG: DUF5686 family protein [Cyclobacteriaceae bacterium]|jgi:hypothetical protein|nr:DUF5686 family protein [Cyclobacteriaceae bacterium]
MKKIAALSFFLILCKVGNSQIINGFIADSTNRSGVAFAHITLSDKKTGTVSDIDGKFTFSLPSNYRDVIYISHVNYQTKKINLQELKSNKVIFLKPKVTELKEVVIRAGENPAWNIIRKAVANRKLNNPQEKKSYTYTSYNKLLFTGAGARINKDSLLKAIEAANKKLTKADSSALEMDRFLERNHFYVTESVTQKYFEQPNKNFEKLITHKASGFRSPLFVTLPNDYQPTGFYQELVPLFGNNYLNPISINSEKKYDFNLSDTLYQERDTLYVIEFEPYPKTTFAALKGKITISTNGYAIKNVIATNADPMAKIGFRIQQLYNFENGYWFPSQLNTDVSMKDYQLNGRGLQIQVRSYLRDVEVNTNVDKKLFSGAQVDLSASSYDIDLDKYRVTTLDEKEERTYFLLDSVRSKVKVFAAMDNLTNGLLSATIPIGKLDIDTKQLLKLNQYENVRLGIGLQTNPKFSKVFQIGGFAGYSFRDQEWKYGGFTKFNLNNTKDWYLQIGYENNIYEAGVQDFFSKLPAVSSKVIRDWRAINFDNITFSYIETGFRIARNWAFTANTKQVEQRSLFDYNFNNDGIETNRFKGTVTSAEINYIGNSQRISFNGRSGLVRFTFPLFSLRVTQAFSPGKSDNLDFTRFDFYAGQTFQHRRLGKSKFLVYGGWLDGAAPVFYHYYGRGNEESSYYVDGYFQTMGINEFIADRYVSAFWSQHFGAFAWNTEFSKPELFIAQSAGWGELTRPADHFSIPLKDYSKGFFESGIGIDNLIRFNYLDMYYIGFGASAFYRYGNYAFDKTQDNLTYRVQLTFSF